MTKDEIKKLSSLGLSEDVNGEFYTIYDFDTIWDLIHQVDDTELDELATDYTNNVGEGKWQELEAYKAGYRKAKEDNICG